MTGEPTAEHHPSDLVLAAWVDEPEIGAADISAHVEGCARCREKVADLHATRLAIALDPPMPSDADFAAQRGRILAAIEKSPREGGGRVVGRIGWLVPLAAAAAGAAIVLVGRTDGPLPGPGPAPEAVLAEAETAAEEAAALALDDDVLDAALETTESPTPSIDRSTEIEAEFALLTEDEQSAVLLELERTDFDL